MKSWISSKNRSISVFSIAEKGLWKNFMFLRKNNHNRFEFICGANYTRIHKCIWSGLRSNTYCACCMHNALKIEKWCTIGRKCTYQTTSAIFNWNQRYIMPTSLWVHFGASETRKCNFTTSFRKRKKEKNWIIKNRPTVTVFELTISRVASSYAYHKTTALFTYVKHDLQF